MPETGLAAVDKGTILKAPNPVLLPKTPSPTNSIIETSSALLASVSSALLRSNSITTSGSSRRLSLAFPDLRALLLTPTSSPIDPSVPPAAAGMSQFACLNLFEEPDGFMDTGFDGVGARTVPILNSSIPSLSSAGTPDLRHSLTDSLTTEGGGGRLKYLDGAASSSPSRCLNDFLDDVTLMDEEDLTDDESDGANDRQIICMAAEAVELHDLLIS
ncbi:hypothetical protein HDU80_003023, partial [Chytriomyces hyalinus]